MTFHGYFAYHRHQPSRLGLLSLPSNPHVPAMMALQQGHRKARYVVYVSLSNVVIFNPSSPRSTPLNIAGSFHTPSTNTCLRLPQTLLTATLDQSASAQVSDRTHPHHFGAMLVEPVACLIPTRPTLRSYMRVYYRSTNLLPLPLLISAISPIYNQNYVRLNLGSPAAQSAPPQLRTPIFNSPFRPNPVNQAYYSA